MQESKIEIYGGRGGGFFIEGVMGIYWRMSHEGDEIGIFNNYSSSPNGL